MNKTECKHYKCFANRSGRCRALSDTDFGGKACPFYKTEAQAAEDRAKAQDRLVAIGRQDLIAYYREG